MLLVPSPQLRAQPPLAADDESADALGPVKLVRANSESSDWQFIKSDGYFAGGLYGIAMKVRSPAQRPSKFGDGLQGSGLMIGEHDADQAKVRIQWLG
jgi:hypothetical protein